MSVSIAAAGRKAKEKPGKMTEKRKEEAGPPYSRFFAFRRDFEEIALGFERPLDELHLKERIVARKSFAVPHSDSTHLFDEIAADFRCKIDERSQFLFQKLNKTSNGVYSFVFRVVPCRKRRGIPIQDLNEKQFDLRRFRCASHALVSDMLSSAPPLRLATFSKRVVTLSRRDTSLAKSAAILSGSDRCLAYHVFVKPHFRYFRSH